MTPLKIIIHIAALTLTALSCNQQKLDKENKRIIAVTKNKAQDSLRPKLEKNIQFIGDSLLKDKNILLKDYLRKYLNDTCGIVIYSNIDLAKQFEGIKNIGDINNDNISDTVIVIPPFNYCEEGQSYAFFDTTLPRLYTDSYCCHPDNLFSIGDINEDGIEEICIFYSSCSSRFKSLIAYTLTDKKWTQIGRSLFDVGIMKPDKEKRIRKISKGKFEMLSIESMLKNGKFVEDRHWEKFSF